LCCLRAWAAGGGTGGGVGPRLLSSVGLSAFVAVALCGGFCGACGRFCGGCSTSLCVAASAVLWALILGGWWRSPAWCRQWIALAAGRGVRASVGGVTGCGAGGGCLPCPASAGAVTGLCGVSCGRCPSVAGLSCGAGGRSRGRCGWVWVWWSGGLVGWWALRACAGFLCCLEGIKKPGRYASVLCLIGVLQKCGRAVVQ